MCDFTGFGEEGHPYSPLIKGEIQLLNTIMKNSESMYFQYMGVEQDQYLVRVCGTDLSHDRGRMAIQGTKGELAIEGSQIDDEEKIMTTKGCSKGKKRDRKRSREDKLDR